MKSKNEIIVVLIICITTIICGILFYPTLYKYEKIRVGQSEIVVKIHRLTGNTEYFLGGEWRLAGQQKEATAETDTNLVNPEEKLPDSAMRRLKAKGGFSFPDLFSVDIYNGNETWVVSKVIIQITIRNEDGKIRSRNKYEEETRIKPLQTESVAFKAIGPSKNEKYEFIIESAYGYKQ